MHVTQTEKGAKAEWEVMEDTQRERPTKRSYYETARMKPDTVQVKSGGYTLY